MNEMTPTAAAVGIGHNSLAIFDPEKAKAHEALIGEKVSVAGEWLDLKALTSEDQAERLNEFITGSRGLWKKIEDERKAEKKPFDDAGTLVQKAYAPLLDRLDKAVTRVKPLLSAWIVEKERLARIEREAAEAAARAEKEAAAKAEAEAIERNDISGEIAAQERAAAADATVKEVAATARKGFGVASASGGGRKLAVRTTREAQINSPALVLVWLRDNDKEGYDAVVAEMQRQCSRIFRSKETAHLNITGAVAVEKRSV